MKYLLGTKGVSVSETCLSRMFTSAALLAMEKRALSRSSWLHYKRLSQTIPAKLCSLYPCSQQVLCTERKMNSHSGKMLEGGPKFWESGDTGIVSMVPGQPTHVESVSDQTAVCDLRQKVAVSVIKATDKEAEGLKSSWTAAVYSSDISATVTP